ncbi:MAG: primosomal protein N' [Tissierellia bacterium]|nr:primosomal protein N' [Tissierellia bacterium]
MYAKLVLKSKTRMTDQLYTYRIPENYDIAVGMRVIVPFGRGNKTSIGIVVEILEEVESTFKIKDIIKTLDNSPILDQELIDIALFMRDEYLSDLSSAFQTVLPPGDIKNITEIYYSDQDNDEFLIFLNSPKTLDQINLKYPDIDKAMIDNYIKMGKIKKRYEFSRKASIKKIKFVEKISNSREKISSRANKQLEIYDYLANNNKVEIYKLLRETSSSLSSLRALERLGLVRIIEDEVFREVLSDEIIDYDEHILTSSQKNVFDRIDKSENKTFLLQGVTGSGKTEIYLQLAKAKIKEGKQVMILVPEIALTPQTIARFAGRFGKKIAVLHSRLSISERFDQWRMIKEGLVSIVVGTRSAVFAPFSNLGLIIIDEEHELSYISEKNPKYDALDIARFRGNYNRCNVVLGTATPRIESYFKTKNKDYELLELSDRANKNPLPDVHVVDMRDELKMGNFSMFSGILRDEIQNSLNEKNQSILFLNKRGHTSYIFCRRCGYILKCDACDVSMTYHKSKGISICHFCGRTSSKPIICPSCGSNAIKEFGAGTEKLEEETIKEFPNARVARMDADTMSKKGNYERIYKLMNEGKIDILIGTQMLSKGFDFKNVRTVGIVSADISLNLPDYRAQEKTFQLLTQVAGRAGRGEVKGNVIIQTYQPNHYAINCAKDHDYINFYENEIKIRREYNYPPFDNIILIRVTHEDRFKANKKAFEIIDKINSRSNSMDFEIIGPNPAVIERINNRFRFNILIKTKNDLERVKDRINNRILKDKESFKGGYHIFVMINPISLF